MKPYDKISRKTVHSAIVIFLGLCLVAFLSSRILGGIGHWIIGINYNYFGYSFCNPTLWLLGLDEMMWEFPQSARHKAGEVGILLLYILSFIVHALAVAFSFCMLADTWNRIRKKN